MEASNVNNFRQLGRYAPVDLHASKVNLIRVRNIPNSSFTKLVDNTHSQRELHYPGTNFLGPGTDIVKRIKNQVLPTSAIDAIALQHDINYLIANNDAVAAARADRLALDSIKLIDYVTNPVQALLMTRGLSIRSSFNLRFYASSLARPKQIGLQLKAIVITTPIYQTTFEKFGINIYKGWLE